MESLLVIARLIVLVLVAGGQLQMVAPADGASVTDYVYGLCNTTPYSSNSSFSRNLNTVMGVLTQRASQTRYYYTNANSSDPTDNTTFVYGLFQCRGDVPLSSCASCVSSILTAGYCRSAIGMRIQLLGCYLRYENSNTFLTYEDSIITSNCSAATSTNSLYQANLATATNRTATAAPKISGYFNASSVGTTNSTIAYALAQCLGYLTPSDCANCLSQYSSRSTTCGDSISGYFYYVSCYYIFDHSPFLFSTSTATSSPSPSIPPSISPGAGPSISASSPSPIDSTAIATSSSSSTGKNNNMSVIVGVAVGVVALLAAATIVVALIFKRWRKKRNQIVSTTNQSPADGYAGIPSNLAQGAPKFSIDELQDATNSFHPDNKLGEGGFGPVYKGTLRNGREVAIKLLSVGSHQGNTEFMNEVYLITSVQHRNLIQLLGCCLEESKRILVYEYLPNRSLDLHLFKNDVKQVLDWKTRFNIIVGIARGLGYLHEDSHIKIVHRDIKPSNILLDNNLNPKIADFGLARLVADEVSHVTTRVAGTMGYVAPEYAIGGHLSEKVDVYSYGLVALEIVSGKRAAEREFEPDTQHILEWAWSLYERHEQVMVADLRMVHVGPVNEAEVARVVHVALLCTQTSPAARPTMSQVYTMLCSQSTILDHPTKPTTILSILSPIHTSSVSSSSRTSLPSSSSSAAGPSTAKSIGGSTSGYPSLTSFSKSEVSTTVSNDGEPITNLYPR